MSTALTTIPASHHLEACLRDFERLSTFCIGEIMALQTQPSASVDHPAVRLLLPYLFAALLLLWPSTAQHLAPPVRQLKEAIVRIPLPRINCRHHRFSKAVRVVRCEQNLLRHGIVHAHVVQR